MDYPHTDEEFDLLSERYADLQEELRQIEETLDVSASDDIKGLYEINDILFTVIDTLIPELVMEEDKDTEQELRYKEFLKKSVKKKDPEAKRRDRVDQIKNREKAAIDLQKDKEDYVRARSSLKTAKLSSASARTPQERSRATQNLQKARTHLDKLNKKDDKTKKEE
jgi:hypothetical protein